jgi:isocitrate dehydrogenase kinase/phosphatase
MHMIPAPQYAHHDALARDCARVVCDVFDDYHALFRATARRAARHFRTRDWVAVREESIDRLRLYGRSVDHAIAQVVRRARDATNDRRLWVAMREQYAALIETRPDREIAATFFSSVTRRRFGTIGVDSEIEFTHPSSRELVAGSDDSTRRWCDGRAGSRALAGSLLASLGHALADPDGDVRRVGDAIARAARDVFGEDRVDGADVLTTLFYRNKGAYLVGRLHAGERRLPLVLALLADDEGIFVDAVLTSPDEIAVVFGFAWTYFHVDVPCPAATVAFLSELMPLKRVDELYTAIGYNKHGKTELYRTLVRHLDGAGGTFEEAPGVKGLVMTVFTLPSLNIVLKIIKDRIGAPKRTTRRRVMDQYHRVFLRDRVGRLADAQLFQGLAFPRRCFSGSLLEELRYQAPTSVRCDGERVIVEHVYTERRVRPLNLYVQEAEPAAAVAAILDYGQAIKDLAAANIFPGDLLLKNFGVSRHGRVIFYDYDELAPLTECRFRRMPLPRSIDDELSAEPWYSVGEHDVFPEEFAPFMVPAGPLRDAFLDAHGDLLDPAWWCAVQERVSAGELVDTFPYPRERRFRR